MAPGIHSNTQRPPRQYRGGRRGKGKKATDMDHTISKPAGSDDGKEVGGGVAVQANKDDVDDHHRAGGVALDGDFNDGEAGHAEGTSVINEDGDTLVSPAATMPVEDNLSRLSTADVDGGGNESGVKRLSQNCSQGMDAENDGSSCDTSSSADTTNCTKGIESQPTPNHGRPSDSSPPAGSTAMATSNLCAEVALDVKHDSSNQEHTSKARLAGPYRPPHHRPGFRDENGGVPEPAPAPVQNIASSKLPTNVAGPVHTNKSENTITGGADHVVGLQARAPMFHPVQHYIPKLAPEDQVISRVPNGAYVSGQITRQQGNSAVQYAPAPPFYAYPQGITWDQYSYGQAAVPYPVEHAVVGTCSNPQQLPMNKNPAVHSAPPQSLDIVPAVQQQVDSATITRPWPEVPQTVREQRSVHLNNLMDGANGTGPTLADILAPDNFPFVETFTSAKPYNHGVVVIKNIPFETTRAEVIAFLGRNSKILNDAQEPVHIIIDRVTSKTKDAYVEFLTMDDAMRAVQRHQATVDRGRTARLGDRPVTVELSSIDTLMAELFPHAWVKWQNGSPFIHPVKDERYEWRNFRGFITEEEMTMLVKHVEQPHRTPFSKDCPQRPYECMISTINKMPWYCGEFITIKQRSAMHKAVMKLMHHLHNAIDQGRSDKTLTPALLRRLGTAAMACPGFSVVQKDNIAVLSRLDKSRNRAFNQPRGANLWVHQLTLGPKERIPMDVVEWYVAFLRDESTKWVLNKPMAERNAIMAKATPASHYFGYLWYELGFPAGKDYDDMSLRQAADIELAAMERIIRRAFQA